MPAYPTRIARAGLVLASLTVFMAAAPAQQSEVDVWDAFLKPKYFDAVELIENDSIFTLDTPYRAEDAALTPVSIKARIPQTEQRYIKTIWLIVDKNPEPLVGVFQLTPQMGQANLAMRVRIDAYTNIRAVAALNTGEHYMVANFVKAQGGCSAPLGSDLKEAMDRLGQMKFRTVGAEKPDATLVGQFIVSHPNITGMQLDQKTRLILPEHYVKKVTLTYNDRLIMQAETGISVSEDPSFRFFFKPESGGKLKAAVEDSKGMHFEHEFDVQI